MVSYQNQIAYAVVLRRSAWLHSSSLPECVKSEVLNCLLASKLHLGLLLPQLIKQCDESGKSVQGTSQLLSFLQLLPGKSFLMTPILGFINKSHRERKLRTSSKWDSSKKASFPESQGQSKKSDWRSIPQPPPWQPASFPVPVSSLAGLETDPGGQVSSFHYPKWVSLAVGTPTLLRGIFSSSKRPGFLPVPHLQHCCMLSQGAIQFVLSD